MKMSDAEIIKAVECCSKQSCEGCPYNDGTSKCLMETLPKDALDLINRLKAENDDLKRDTIPKLQNSLERANKYGIETDKENERLKAENERLINIPPKDPMDFCGVVCNFAEELISRAKSEAYKEFVTKAEKKAQNAQTWTGIEPVVTVSDLNNILKEMG